MPPRSVPFAASVFVLAPLVLALASVSAVHAQMYKWVDERGVTNYSNEPPRGRTTPRPAPVQDRLSTYPGSAPAPSASTGASAPDPLRQRVDELERQLERERQQRIAPAESEAERRRRAYEECVRARGVDCDALGELPSGVAPAVVFVPARQAHIVPTLPLQARDRGHDSRGRRAHRDDRSGELPSGSRRALLAPLER